jgi:hypothetical protein
LQNVDYQYNVRGWMKSINEMSNLAVANSPKDLFAFKINPRSRGFAIREYSYNPYWCSSATGICRTQTFRHNRKIQRNRITRTKESYRKASSNQIKIIMLQNRYLYNNKKRSTMNLQAIKMELIEMLISTRKAAVLKKIRTILEEEKDRLTEEDYKIIDVRRERHLKGESQSFSWEEVKQKIQNR